MRSPSPGIWRTRIAIKEEVLRQKVHLDVKYCSFNCENVSVALTAVFLKQNMPKVKGPPICLLMCLFQTFLAATWWVVEIISNAGGARRHNAGSLDGLTTCNSRLRSSAT